MPRDGRSPAGRGRKLGLLHTMITAVQVKAARGLINLSKAQRAEMAGLGIATIKRIEASPEVRGSLWKIQAALQAAVSTGRRPRLTAKAKGPKKRVVMQGDFLLARHRTVVNSGP